MSSDALVILGIIFFVLAIVVFAAGLLAFTSGASRRARREEYIPPPPPGPSPSLPREERSSDALGPSRGQIRWGSVEFLGRPEIDEVDVDVYRGGGIVWGEEGLQPTGTEVAARRPHKPAGGAPEQEKCPICRHLFIETGELAVVRCATPTCRTLIHQECLQVTVTCPICHGTRFVPYR